MADVARAAEPIAPSGRRGIAATGWARATALGLGGLYLAFVAVGAAGTSRAGHDGVMRTHTEERTADGLIVGEVAPGSPADRAGLSTGDVVLAVDGVPANDEALHDLYHRQRAGDATTLVVRRAAAPAGGPPETLSLTLVSRLAIRSVLFDLVATSAAGLLIMAMAVGVALARPSEPATRLLLVFGTAVAAMPVAGVVHWALPTAWLADTLDSLTLLLLGVGAAALLHLFLVFPAPHPLWVRLRRAGWGLPLLYGPPVALGVASIALGAWGLPMPVVMVTLVATLGALARSYRRAATPLARAQLKWVLWALAVGVAAAVLAPFFPAATGGRAQWVVPMVGIAAWALFPTSIGVAILRYRLFDVDLVIGRTLVYAALTACIVAVYALAVGAVGLLFHGQGADPLAPLLAAGLVAVLFQPLRARLQRAANRLLYGERDEPYAVLSRLGQRLGATLAPEAVLPTVVRTVREALKLPYAAVALLQDGRLAVAAEAGDGAADGALRLPLAHGRETLGELIVAPRASGEPFGLADRRLLEDLAREAGAAVHAARLTADLRRARGRLVAAREEERRRLRRDLHDGLGPALAAQTLKVGAARSLLRRDPDAADARLAELEGDLAAALADVRRLVYGLRPPALDDLGLIAAIREGAAQYAGPGAPRVAVEAPDRLPPLPAAVEVAAYRIVQEALANVVRHADARTCRVRLTTEADALVVEVLDDGVGVPFDRHVGVGLVSMRERAAELGGACTVEAQPGGGTRVVAWLPLTAGDAVRAESDGCPV